jgi:hypothetical protein
MTQVAQQSCTEACTRTATVAAAAQLRSPPAAAYTPSDKSKSARNTLDVDVMHAHRRTCALTARRWSGGARQRRSGASTTASSMWKPTSRSQTQVPRQAVLRISAVFEVQRGNAELQARFWQLSAQNVAVNAVVAA